MWSCMVRGRRGDEEGDVRGWSDGGHGWLRRIGCWLTSDGDESAAVTIRMAWMEPVPKSAEKSRAA